MKLDDVLINRYLMAVLGRDIRGNFDVSTPTGDWKDWLLNELAYRTFDVSSNGDVATTGIRLGTLSFHSVDEIHAAFCDRPWFNVQATCPWVTGALGFVSWDNYTALPREETLSLPQSLVEIGWGRVVHFEAVRDPLVRFAFPLVECTWQFGGFARGENFLSLEERFLDDIASRINGMLPRLGILNRVSAADRETAMRGQYTPVQFWLAENEPLVDVNRQPIENPELLLKDASIEVWGFDPNLFEFEHWWLH